MGKERTTRVAIKCQAWCGVHRLYVGVQRIYVICMMFVIHMSTHIHAHTQSISMD